MLTHVKQCVAGAGVSSYEELEGMWLIDIDLDGNMATPDDLSLLLKQRTNEDSYILVQPGFGATKIEVITATTPDVFLSTLLPAIRALPARQFSYVAASVGAEVTWAAIDKHANAKVCFHLSAARNQTLTSLSGGVLPPAVLCSTIEAKLTDLWAKGVTRSKVDMADFCRWPASECGPTTHRPIDPAVLLLE